MSYPVECPVCEGIPVWLDIDGNQITCTRCHGTGEIEDDEPDEEDDECAPTRS